MGELSAEQADWEGTPFDGWERASERGPSQVSPYGAASSPKGRAKVASLGKNDTAKLQFSERIKGTLLYTFRGTVRSAILHSTSA